MKNRTLILTAAKLLEEDAKLTHQSCAGMSGPWCCADCEKDESGRCSARRSYDERMKVVKQLRAAK